MTLSRRRFLALGAAGGATVALHPERALSAAGRAEWEAGAPLPRATQEVYCTTWNGQIVVAGGLRSGADSNRRFTTLKETAFFDPSTETWTRGPALPSPRHHIVLAETNGTVYGFGGFVGKTLRDGFQFRRDVYSFDGDQWARIGTMPRPLGETVALAVEGRVHLMTGSLHPNDGASEGASRAHLVYDPGADAWSDARPVPTRRSSATGAVIDGHVYVVAGRRTDGGVTNLGAVERYDPATDTWAELRPLPQPSGGLAGAAFDGMLYVFGGEYFSEGGGVYEHTWAYDPDADAWTQHAPMPTPRHGLAGAALEGHIYAIGGNTAAGIGAATSSAVERLSPTAN